MIYIVPISIKGAKAFVAKHHRHNKPPQGAKFAIGCCNTEHDLVGVAIIGRPIARRLDDGLTAEVVRLCTNDKAPKNTCSKLYGASWRASKAMGYKKIITYTLQSESGASLRGAGYKIIAETKARTDGWLNRDGRVAQDVYAEDKWRWEKE